MAQNNENIKTSVGNSGEALSKESLENVSGGMNNCCSPTRAGKHLDPFSGHPTDKKTLIPETRMATEL